ncbi:hypothetical protein D8674_038479 [Pyrus ussuriensis x Pyrus communis]|uniref:Uncharacterized protein n=1 Tax=Pyrus ussuriensis x Pyrus communis TaxID=2448454 RepID=A0A5N5FCB0_9ROSA|nr:hypothetical protein D8674_038479 [Pyrus ussuriensis x Pyrus communis]
MMEEYDRIAQNQNSKLVRLPSLSQNFSRGRCADERWRVRGSCFDLLFFKREEDEGLEMENSR